MMDNLTAKVAHLIREIVENGDDSGGGEYTQAAQAILAIPEIASALRDQAEFVRVERLD